MSCPLAAEVKHDLCLLHKCQTCGLGLLVTVSRENNNFVVLGDTDCLPWIFLGIVLIGIGQYDLAIINKHRVDAEGFLDIALIGIIIRSVAYLDASVFENRKICGSLAAGDVISVHDKHTGRLSGCHVVVRGIDTRYHCAVVIRITCR